MIPACRALRVKFLIDIKIKAKNRPKIKKMLDIKHKAANALNKPSNKPIRIIFPLLKSALINF